MITIYDLLFFIRDSTVNNDISTSNYVDNSIGKHSHAHSQTESSVLVNHFIKYEAVSNDNTRSTEKSFS